MSWRFATPEDEATWFAMNRGLVLVLLPGAIFVFGLIWLVAPSRHEPISQSWANGTYINACCAPVTLKDGVISNGRARTHYRLFEGKQVPQMEVEAGIGVKNGAVDFGDKFVFASFNEDKPRPYYQPARSFVLFKWDDGSYYVFTKK